MTDNEEMDIAMWTKMKRFSFFFNRKELSISKYDDDFI